ncbi:DUF4248 domain-containing protein [Bacteroides sp. 214]|uniref:DUF4248 domain-containing protein n=1 Tax=Bacteroides sp. 214 TaxID=2302935 RepID=UPI0013D22B0A|nr:DUF4248 domain-containing protein [Bacteroides sp. 214]NDW13425.1 DUF4248 domain-containing protein [Bacteroides sp. 214]
MNENYIEQPFELRSYVKADLVRLYFPGYAYSTAIRMFNSWMKLSRLYENDLGLNSMNKYTRIYTKAQVKKIVDHFGEP